MDSAKKQIDTWDFSNDDMVTITSVGQGSDILSTIDLSDLGTIDLSSLTTTINGAQGSTGGPYIISNGLSADWGTYTTPMTVGAGGQISLSGENADIVVNGVSLMDKINAIGERLNLLEINKELEEEWDQLRELGEQYRQLEEELKAKSAMWKTLKTKTPSKPRS